MEQTFTSSFHVNSWHFGLVVLTRKSGNEEVDGGREIESSKFLPHFAELLCSSVALIPSSILLPVFIYLNSPFSWIISPGVISSSSLMTHKSDDDFLKHIFRYLSQVGLHVLARAGEEGEMESLLDVQIALSLMCSLSWGTSQSPLLQERKGMLPGPQWGFVGRCSQAFGHTPWMHSLEHLSDYTVIQSSHQRTCFPLFLSENINMFLLNYVQSIY